jgi:hypothetical protein
MTHKPCRAGAHEWVRWGFTHYYVCTWCGSRRYEPRTAAWPTSVTAPSQEERITSTEPEPTREGKL